MLNLYYEYLAEEAMSDAAEAAYAAELAHEAEIEAEREREDELCEALRRLATEGEWDLYSDLFKGLHGFRPRGDAWHWYD